MEPLERTTSAGSAQSRTSSYYLSAASPNNADARKGRPSDVGTSGAAIENGSISMPPPNTSLGSLRRPSTARSVTATSLAGSLVTDGETASARDSSAIEDSDLTPTLERSRRDFTSPDIAARSTLSEPDLDSNRMSFSSLYNYGTALYDRARGAITSAPGSVQGSEIDGNTAGTTATSAVSITTSSQNGALSPTIGTSVGDSILASPFDFGNGAASPRVPASASPTQTSNVPARTVRGRLPVSRKASGNTLQSASPSTDRSRETEDGRPQPVGMIGVCALDSKARSKPSRNILNKLIKNGDFDVTVFGDKVILDEAVENWPVCDFLISFFSDGFPLDKAIAYAKLRRPFCVNDLPMQTILWDRRICLKILDKLEVPTPKRVELNRDGGARVETLDIAQRLYDRTGLRYPTVDVVADENRAMPKVEMLDDDDTICIDGKKLTKPFVEKPTSGEDHNIYIYYPRSQGGGGRRLFRKINNKSSEKDPTLVTPRGITEPESSYIYEQFLKVENAEDVKAYTVGANYCHAETRKSPVVDGLVKRNPNGKEIRYVTALSPEEASMAARIVDGFGQRVCGFDLLRVGDKSYVIDVNGWSFVKDNNEYYDKCANIMRDMFVREKIKWDNKAVSASDTETESSDKPLGPPSRKTTGLSAHSHRNALKSVLRSPSISRLKELGHRKQAPASGDVSVNTSPLVSPPNERVASSAPKSTPAALPHSESLPPPALPGKEEDALTLERSLSEEGVDHVVAPAPAAKSQWKLKGMVAVIRHADRTPKQKFKFTFHTKPFVDLLKGHREEVLLVGEAALLSVQEAVKEAMQQGQEDPAKLRTLLNALQKKGAWPGTKVQIKPMFRKRKEAPPALAAVSEVDGASKVDDSHAVEEGSPISPGEKKFRRSESASETTLSRIHAAEDNLLLEKLQLVMKWGGEPTHSARYQAQDLGENMRNDLLLMNRDTLNNVSIFSSSERRVTTSAQIFASAFQDQKEIDPSVIQVRKDLLDDSNAAKDEMDKVKKKLKGLLRQGKQAPEQFSWPRDGTPEPYLVVRKVVELMKFHRKVMRRNFNRLQTEAQTSLEKIKKGSSEELRSAAEASKLSGDDQANATGVDIKDIQFRWCAGEDAELFKERWEKLFDEFTDAEKVDPSKISELYDTMKFDALHNRQFLEWVFTPRDAVSHEEASVDPSLERTMSSVAREEYQQTHNAIAEGKETSETAKLHSRPSSIKSTESSGHRHSISSTFKPSSRRPSESAKSILNKSQEKKPSDDQSHPESYFSLFTGNTNAPVPKARNDARLDRLREMYRLSKVLFDYIGPQEYGMLDSEKLEIGLLTSLPLLKEIVKDLEEVQASDDARSFVYFTKESHIYTLLNCILEGGVQTKIARNAIPELDYISQICFELYESHNENANTNNNDHGDQVQQQNHDQESGTLQPQESTFNYSIRIAISPGCHTFDPLDVQLDSKHCIGCAPRRGLTPHGDWKEVIETLKNKFHTVKLPKSFLAVNLSEKVPMPESGKSEGGGSGAEEGGKVECSPIAPQH